MMKNEEKGKKSRKKDEKDEEEYEPPIQDLLGKLDDSIRKTY